MNTTTSVRAKSFCKELSLWLEYPRSEYMENLDRWMASIPESGKVADSLKSFRKNMAAMNLARMQEIYTRTFDLSPVCTPYVTAYIYGDENFERGGLMSGLITRYDQVRMDLDGELPDHIACILRFMALADDDEAIDLAGLCLEKPLVKMVDDLKKAQSPYLPLFEAIQATVRDTAEGGQIS